MHNKLLEQHIDRSVERTHFSKELIREIVKSAERGATRRELTERYGMTKSTLSNWIQDYGSNAFICQSKVSANG